MQYAVIGYHDSGIPRADRKPKNPFIIGRNTEMATLPKLSA